MGARCIETVWRMGYIIFLSGYVNEFMNEWGGFATSMVDISLIILHTLHKTTEHLFLQMQKRNLPKHAMNPPLCQSSISLLHYNLGHILLNMRWHISEETLRQCIFFHEEVCEFYTTLRYNVPSTITFNFALHTTSIQC